MQTPCQKDFPPFGKGVCENMLHDISFSNISDKICKDHGKCLLSNQTVSNDDKPLKCDCDTDWSGSACQCKSSQDECKAHGQTCMGEGKCHCEASGTWTCNCNPDEGKSGNFEGKYCQRPSDVPQTGSDLCSMLQPCVKLYLVGLNISDIGVSSTIVLTELALIYMAG